MLLESFIKYSTSGFKNVDIETKKHRNSICNSCELWNSKSNRCNHCGCFLDIKTSWATESCPLGKWKELSKEEISPTANPSFFAKPGGCGCGK